MSEVSLKSQLSDSYDDLNKLKYRMNSTGTPIDEGSVSSVQSTDKPIVYLIGTSNIQGIDETKLTHAAKVTKFTAYTLEETTSAFMICPFVLCRMESFLGVVSETTILTVHHFSNKSFS
jgi:hypothetical protein